MDKEEIIGFDAIWESSLKCKKGVMWKDSAATFIHNGIEQSFRLSEELKKDTYRERPHKFFTVTEPKERHIMSISFRDRVYQRSLNDNAIYPAVVPHFIRDNCACQRGRGTDDARDRLAHFLRKYYRKFGKDGYVLQIDIQGYYPNMRHDVAKDNFHEYLDDETYDMAARILDGFPGEVGFNPGSQIVQIEGVSIPNKIDHFIKEQLRCKFYLRYMDDMILISDSKDYLKDACEQLEQKFKALGFHFHPKKTQLYPISQGIHFLGFVFKLTSTGKALRLLPSEKVRHERRKLRHLVSKAKRSELSREKVDQCFECWIAHAEKGNTWHLVQRMKQYYNSLWEEE